MKLFAKPVAYGALQINFEPIQAINLWKNHMPPKWAKAKFYYFTQIVDKVITAEGIICGIITILFQQYSHEILELVSVWILGSITIYWYMQESNVHVISQEFLNIEDEEYLNYQEQLMKSAWSSFFQFGYMKLIQ